MPTIVRLQIANLQPSFPPVEFKLDLNEERVRDRCSSFVSALILAIIWLIDCLMIGAHSWSEDWSKQISMDQLCLVRCEGETLFNVKCRFALICGALSFIWNNHSLGGDWRYEIGRAHVDGDADWWKCATSCWAEQFLSSCVRCCNCYLVGESAWDGAGEYKFNNHRIWMIDWWKVGWITVEHCDIMCSCWTIRRHRRRRVCCWSLIVDRWLLIVDCWSLIVDRWLVIVDCWLLIADCWLLIVDCWLAKSEWTSLSAWIKPFPCWDRRIMPC